MATAAKSCAAALLSSSSAGMIVGVRSFSPQYSPSHFSLSSSSTSTGFRRSRADAAADFVSPSITTAAPPSFPSSRRSMFANPLDDEIRDKRDSRNGGSAGDDDDGDDGDDGTTISSLASEFQRRMRAAAFGPSSSPHPNPTSPEVDLSIQSSSSSSPDPIRAERRGGAASAAAAAARLMGRRKPKRPENLRRVETLMQYKETVADERDRMVVVRFYAPWCKVSGKIYTYSPYQIFFLMRIPLPSP